MRAALLDGIDEADYLWLQERLRARRSVDLGLVEQAEERLAPLLWRRHVPGFGALMRILREEPEGLLADEAFDRLANGGTWFFQDPHPCQLLRSHALSALAQSRGASRRLRLWSVACGDGQEPYSLAMLIQHAMPPMKDWDISILATDASAGSLARAQAAAYDRDEVGRGLPLSMLTRYFDQQGLRWVVQEQVRRMVAFQPLRLEGVWKGVDAMDLILLRNVMAGLDAPARANLVRRAAAQLNPGGWLVLEPQDELGAIPGLTRVETPHGQAWRASEG
jgi:chemotaxis protein methyltransferase CheR